MILGVVPTNLIDPFLKNNTAQLVILGLLIGAGVLVLGDSVPEHPDCIGKRKGEGAAVRMEVRRCFLCHIYNLYIIGSRNPESVDQTLRSGEP